MSEAERTLYCLLGAYAATGVALFSGMWLGHRSHIKAHIATIVVFLAGFLVTLYFAEKTGTFFKFDAQRQSIHMPFAYSATGLALAPLVTGFRRWRGSGSLFAHRAAVVVWMLFFVGASGTGFYMLLARTPK